VVILMASEDDIVTESPSSYRSAAVPTHLSVSDDRQLSRTTDVIDSL